MPVKRLALFLLLISPAWGITFLNKWRNSMPNSGGATLTVTVAPTAGNTLLVQVFVNTSTSGTTVKTSDNTACASDNAVRVGTSAEWSYFWRCPNVASGITGVIVTPPTQVKTMAFVQEINAGDIPSSPIDVKDTTGQKLSSTTWQTGSMVTTNANDVVLGFGCAAYAGYTITVTAPDTQLDVLGANAMYCIVSQHVVSSTGTYQPTGTVSTAEASYSLGITYKLNIPDYSVSGPSSGYVHVASTNFTLTNTTSWYDARTITVSDGGNAGTVTSCNGTGTAPYAISFSGAWSTCTFIYTPAVTGALTLAFSISTGTNPTPSTSAYTSNAWTLAISGCTSGNMRVASSSCTVTLTGGTFDGTHTVTLSDAGSLGTFTSGSSGNPLTVTPTALTSSFTYTYTPYLAGKKLMSATANLSYWTATSAIYTSSSTDVCTFTAKASGNWASAGTWTPSGCTGGGHTAPDSGDSVVLTGYHVTIPASTTGYIGSCPANNTTYDLQIAPTAYNGTSGTLEVAGTLWLCGNTRLSAAAPPGNYSGTPTAWPILQLDTGASLILDNNRNASVAYRMVSSAEWGWGKLYAGTLNDACAFATGSCPTTIKGVNLGAANPDLYEAIVADALVYRIYGTGVSDCGSASKGCLEYQTQTTGIDTYTDAGVIDLEGNIFLRTGTFQAPTSGLAQGNPKPSFVNNRFLSDLAGVGTLDGSSLLSSGSCTIFGNYFSGTFGYANQTLNGCVVSGNVFAQNMIGLGNSPFSGNLFVTPGSDGFGNAAVLANNYVVSTEGTSSAHMYLAAVVGTGWNYKMSGNVAESLDAAQGEGHCGAVTSPGQSAYAGVVLNNLSILSVAGFNSCEFAGYDVATSNAATETTVVDHNGSNGTPGTLGWILFDGHSTSYYPANTIIPAMRANIGYAPSAGSGYYMVGDLDQSVGGPGNAPATLFNTANVDYNDTWHGNASSLYSGSHDANCAPASTFNGSPYQICATTGGPGAHELVANPNYIDTTRNISKWATTHGAAQSLTGALSAFQVCTSVPWCVQELLTYVRRGYQPTNLALKGKAHDGRIVGFTGAYGSGYTGSCTVTFTPQDAADLGSGAAATCSFVGGVPVIQITNSGANYRIATPAIVTIGGTCTGVCVAASLTPVISPHDIGPVQMNLIPGVM